MGVAQRYGSTKCHYLVHVKMNGEKVNFTLCEFHFVKKEEVGERENVGVKQQGRDWTLLLACEVEEGAASRGTGGASPSEWGRRGSGCSPDTSENECSPASTSTAAQRDLCWNCNYRTVTRYICIVSRHRTQTHAHTPSRIVLHPQRASHYAVTECSSKYDRVEWNLIAAGVCVRAQSGWARGAGGGRLHQRRKRQLTVNPLWFFFSLSFFFLLKVVIKNNI